MNKLIDLLSEPSTYAGLSGLALTIGLSSEEYQAVAQLLAAIFACVAVFKPEKKDA